MFFIVFLKGIQVETKPKALKSPLSTASGFEDALGRWAPGGTLRGHAVEARVVDLEGRRLPLATGAGQAVPT